MNDSDRSQIVAQLLENIFQRHKSASEGKVADYIPALAKADPSLFGISLVSTDGKIVEIGDCGVEFTIQSTSKAFVFAMALSSHGRENVYQRVGVEPSGDAFNSIVLDKRQRAHNPMVNAGAITTSGFIEGADLEQRKDQMLKTLSAAAGRKLVIDEEVYLSESATGHRNRAIAWMLTNFDKMDLANNLETLELYFMQCSVLVTARDLAVMAATLANMGINPVTGENVFAMDCIQDVLSVMFTCGMYDYAGEWAFRVGIPAKSGVAGGIMGVVNRQIGIGTYSPLLDERGNSIRGINVFKDLSEELGLHAFNFMNHGSNFLKTLSG